MIAVMDFMIHRSEQFWTTTSPFFEMQVTESIDRMQKWRQKNILLLLLIIIIIIIMSLKMLSSPKVSGIYKTDSQQTQASGQQLLPSRMD